jgi:hypothetical protein
VPRARASACSKQKDIKANPFNVNCFIVCEVCVAPINSYSIRQARNKAIKRVVLFSGGRHRRRRRQLRSSRAEESPAPLISTNKEFTTSITIITTLFARRPVRFTPTARNALSPFWALVKFTTRLSNGVEINFQRQRTFQGQASANFDTRLCGSIFSGRFDQLL